MICQDDAFHGTKLALICGESVITYLRDDKASIPFPAMWDFAGGERHGTEGPVECGLRELFEEFGLRVEASRVQALTCFRKPGGTTLPAYFGVVHVTPDEIDSIRFGDEGQYWTLMSLYDYLRHPRAIPFLQERLAAYLNVTHASTPQN
jgi:8-oxo-dGTP diphosphatase